MKTSCISHPPKTPLVIIRQEYLAICDGDHCEAAILNQFEYWTNIKLGHKEQAEIESEIARAGGLEGFRGDLWIYKTQTELHEELMGLFGIRAVGTALQSLVDRGFLERRNNPKYAWDRTYQYRLETRKVQDAILQKCKMEKAEMQPQRLPKRDIEPDKIAPALPKITSEIIPEITEGEKESDFSEKPKADPLLLEQERKTLTKRAQAGGNYAVPPDAGGADPFMDGPVDAFAIILAGITPVSLPSKERESWARKLRQIAERWSIEGAVITAEDMEQAIRAVPDSEIGWKTYTSPYGGHFDTDIGPVLLSVTGEAEETEIRRARDVEASEASLAALDARRAARPPPPQDDAVGRGVKMQLEVQMGRNGFRQYVEPTRFTCDDGALVVAAPDDFTRDWLESNLGMTIERALAGVAGGPGEVVFEVVPQEEPDAQA